MFVAFGTSHIATLAIIFGAGLGLAATVRLCGDVRPSRRPSRRLGRIIRWVLAAGLIAIWALQFLFLFDKREISAATALPMNLCDWTTILAIVTLVRPSQRAFEIAYFWTFCGTLQALLTPDLAAGFPDPRFLFFFGLHGTVMASMLFLTLGAGMRPWPSSIPRAVVWTLVYLVAALAVNRLFGTDFGYLAAKPAHPSLLDFFAPWPWRIGEMILAGGALIVLFYSPFHLKDWLASRRQAGA